MRHGSGNKQQTNKGSWYKNSKNNNKCGLEEAEMKYGGMVKMAK